MDNEVGGQFWWAKRQAYSFGGQRGRWTVLVDRWTVLVDNEAGGLFGWAKRQAYTSCGQ